MSETPKKGNYTTTYKIRFYTNQIQYFKLTQKIYNELIKKYYELLFKNAEFLNLSNQKCLRELEKITIIGLTGEKPREYFEQNAPTELRRAAINQAIGLVRSYFELLKMAEEGKKINTPQKATTFNCSLTLYKGMYKNIQENGKVSIKLFDGENWKWFNAKFKDWKLPKDAQILSPTIVINKNYVMAHVPVKRKIEDITPIKERMKNQNVRICGIAFANNDNVATCVVIDKTGKVIKTLFVSGGNQYKNEITKILNKKRKNILNNKKLEVTSKNHKTYREKISRIVNYYAHIISRKIVNFCIENEVKVIAIPLSTKDKVYYYTKGTPNRPIYLRENITNYLNYKGFGEGILTSIVLRKDKASKCYKCGRRN